MVIGPDYVREMKRGEDAEVDTLLQAAFGGSDEERLVARLRKSRVIAGEQVMPMGDRIVGYYALSYMVKPKGWLCLAPVAIAPDVQRRGYGKRMMGMLSEWSRLTGTPIVVLGNPDFYEKAGFSKAAAANLSGPYRSDHMMVSGVTGAPGQTLIYPAAFDAPAMG